MKSRIFALFAVSLTICVASAAQATIRLGVLAPAGEATALQQWTGVADELEKVIGESVVLSAGSAGDLLARLEHGDLDVIIGNPVQAAIAASRMDAQPIASVVKQSGVQFAGVIIANPNAGITTATDLRGKKVMTLKSTAAGGFIFQAHYLIELGVNVPGDFARHAEAKNQKDIVKLVAKGVFDAGFVRTGMIDRMIKSGEISEGDVVIVDRKETPGFSLAHTTELYPEWMVFTHSQLDTAVVSRVRNALTGFAADNPALTPARVKGFDTPQDLTSTISALTTVGILDGGGS